jgi:adenosylmethionine-8-amino-7-oxononanoate aminotransferase
MPSSPPKWRSGSRFFAVPALRPTKLLRSQAGPSAGGLPLSGVVGRAEITNAPLPGDLGRTCGGNALGYAAALAVLDAFEQDGLLDRVERLGERLEAGLRELARKHSIIGDVHGPGFMQRFIDHYQERLENLLERNIGIEKYFSYIVLKRPIVKNALPL